MEPQVNPCPFCGCPAPGIFPANLDIDMEYQVECHCCYAAGPFQRNEKDAVAAWNRIQVQPESGGHGGGENGNHNKKEA